MDDDYDEDEYAPIGDGYDDSDPDNGDVDDALFEAVTSDDAGDVDMQDGPDLFGEEPDHSKAEIVAAAMRPLAQDEPPEPSAAPQPNQRGGEEAMPLALYRRYRPDTFADVIGQEHVTQPLQRALTNNRVNHAYLFSGPRGCGKTTSARILARCLNCAVGPTPTPCGECQSCTDLARGGPGSIDVIEIDAASHGGVDDARDLRERAFFAPVQSRYKIYIVDEAHMVTTAGFNALLKLVEEPPPHVKFIFATTEPEKVIGTIRSRTHHYPFRLVPPRLLIDYLAGLCEAEGVDVEQTVLPLVVRAGAGSVRDSLSVLDQLLGAADAGTVRYAQAAALLGYTPDALLDEIIDAFAAGDSATVFSTIDKVIEVGQDPRRFAEDLLRRLRDLIVVSAVPEAAAIGLIDVAEDQAQRFDTQVAGMGRGELTRAAEVLASGLTEMRGTTAPRLHLELMCARVLLPGADVDGRGLHARMDRLERRVGMLGDESPSPEQWSDVPGRGAGRAPGAAGAEAPAERPRPPEAQQRQAPPTQQRPAPAQQRPAPAQQRPAPAERRPAPAQQKPAPTQRPAEVAEPAVAKRPTEHAAAAAASPRVRQFGTAEVRSVWPQILDQVKERRRFTWMVLSQQAQVIEVANGALTLGFGNPGARDSFGQRGSIDILRDVMIDEIGADLQILTILTDGTPDAPHQRPAGTSPQTAAAAPRPEPSAPAPEPPAEEFSDDDELIVDEGLSAAQLLANELGAEIIHEEPNT